MSHVAAAAASASQVHDIVGRRPDPGFPVAARDDARVLVVDAAPAAVRCGLYSQRGPAAWAGSVAGLHAGGVAALDAALQILLNEALSHGEPPLAVVHRVLHGGDRHAAAARLDEATLRSLQALVPLAPGLQGAQLAGVAALRRAWPEVPQLACFDTAFHATQPALERRLALPRALAREGLRRHGFDGLACAGMVASLLTHSAQAEGRCVLMHLGATASACGTWRGRSQASTSGFSPLDGLVSATGCGSLDPGVLLHLMRQGWDADALEQLLARQSGLLGVSGLSADWRALRAADDPRAGEAIDLFTRRLVREVGALVALLGGVDLLAFGGDIGLHDPLLRAAVADALAWMGVRMDAQANAAATGRVATPLHAHTSDVEVWCVPVDEARVAADAGFALLDAGARPLAQ